MRPHPEVYGPQPPLTLLGRLNSSGHERALRVFMVVVLAHWAEHLLQALQIYGLGWSMHEAHGALGLLFPWLVTSEVLHYTYAIVMLVGLCVLRRGFAGVEDRRWWTIAIWIQCFHHLEHALLLGQSVLGQNLFNRPVPTSLVQLWVPRVELHLFYNTIVFIPMVIALYHHLFPSFSEGSRAMCSCAWRRGIASITRPEEDRSLSRRAWRRLPSHTSVYGADNRRVASARPMTLTLATANPEDVRRGSVRCGPGYTIVRSSDPQSDSQSARRRP